LEKDFFAYATANSTVDTEDERKLPSAEAGGLRVKEVDRGHPEGLVDQSLLISIDIC
jgi:hypothetical protein